MQFKTTFLTDNEPTDLLGQILLQIIGSILV